MTERPPYNLNCPGWMAPDELEWLYQTARTMQSVVEIGSFKGRSAIAFLNACKLVYCVDPWTFPGDSNVAEAFVSNVMAGAGRLPIMYPMTSFEAAPLVPSADMVFVDGNHDRIAVALDLALWRPKAIKLICGHDYSVAVWPDVKGTVDAWAKREGLKVIQPATSIWAVWLQGGAE